MRVFREFVEMTDSELESVVIRLSSRRNALAQSGYELTCRQCGQVLAVSAETYSHYESNKGTGRGFTAPKCAECWD